MANDTTIYISIPIIEAMVFRVEQEDSDTEYENAIKAMSSSILGYYFPPVNGFSVTLTSERNRNNDKEYDYGYESRIFRIRRHGLNSRGIVDHTVTAGVGRCWVLLIRGVEFMFYEYHQHQPGNHCLLPWGPRYQPGRNVYHVRWDAETIDWMLRRMVQQDTPPIRP